VESLPDPEDAVYYAQDMLEQLEQEMLFRIFCLHHAYYRKVLAQLSARQKV